MFPYAEVLAAPLIKIAGDVMNRVLPPEKMSEEERAKAQQELATALLQADWQQIGGQLQINLEEAKSESLFVAGWRPFVGWVCGASLAYNFVAQPMMAFTIGAFAWQLPPLPTLDMSMLGTVLMGILGLGGLRTFEKWQGVHKD